MNQELEMEGIQPGAVIHSVGKWSARDKGVNEVFEHIRATKKRPLTVKFLVSTSPNHCRHPDVRMRVHVCLGLRFEWLLVRFGGSEYVFRVRGQKMERMPHGCDGG